MNSVEGSKPIQAGHLYGVGALAGGLIMCFPLLERAVPPSDSLDTPSLFEDAPETEGLERASASIVLSRSTPASLKQLMRLLITTLFNGNSVKKSVYKRGWRHIGY
jgi:hypothetical protein